MNFMPSEDAFFDEPLTNNNHPSYAPEVLGIHHQQQHVVHNQISSKADNDVLSQLLESSKRQEHLLERLVSELERANRRLGDLERLQPTGAPTQAPKGLSPGSSPVSTTTSRTPTRGSLVLPPGSKPLNVPNLPDRKPITPAEDPGAREREEQAAILRRRAEEEARIARIEAERKQREEEEERKRIEELKRIEEEKKRKEELEKKTRGLMTGLFTDVSGGLFGPEDDLDSATKVGGKKTGGGLFDD